MAFPGEIALQVHYQASVQEGGEWYGKHAAFVSRDSTGNVSVDLFGK